VLRGSEVVGICRGLPDPGIAVPKIAVPTVLVWLGSATAWTAASALVLTDLSRWWLMVTIPVQAFVTFSMFTVLHESIHHTVGRLAWVNPLLGRLSMPFVSLFGTFPMLRYVHVEHHRNTNEDFRVDPDAWSAQAPWWQLPVRWMAVDAWYCCFYLTSMRRRPRREVVGFLFNLFIVIPFVCIVVDAGYGWEFLLVYVVPERIGLGILAWLFDWLPHHGLAGTAKTDRFHATRIRVGWESVMNLLLFYQNYHLVHHIQPAIPFYLYVKAWQNTEADYLDRSVPITTPWGRELTPLEYRAWRESTSWRDPNAPAQAHWQERTRFHSLRVAELRRLTAKSVSITFDVPPELAAIYRFQAGQSILVRANIDGQKQQRSYSICAAAGSGVLRIAVKHLEGGVFSHYANTVLRQGDVLEVMPPSGQFTLTPARARGRKVGAIAAGSGITPIISILGSALAAEPRTHATLLYANHDSASVMFGPELTMLRREFGARLQITHFFSGSPNADVAVDSEIAPGRYQRVESGRLTANRLASMLTAGRGGRHAVDEWYICGPEELTATVTNTLTAHGVPDSHIHRELFVSKNQTMLRDNAAVRSAVTVTLNNAITRLTTTGNESLLEAALRSGIDAPYSCSSGACGKCKAKLLLGNVDMAPTHALSEADVVDGWILTCQSRPVTEAIHVNYDREQTRSTNRTGHRHRVAKLSSRQVGIRGQIRQRLMLDDARRGGGVVSEKTSL
jgi:ferredoxin-NADP reductase/fatty acid desaturase